MASPPPTSEIPKRDTVPRNSYFHAAAMESNLSGATYLDAEEFMTVQHLSRRFVLVVIQTSGLVILLGQKNLVKTLGVVLQ